MRLDIKWVKCEGVDGAIVPGNFWSCGGGFARFARGGAHQLPRCLALDYRSVTIQSLFLLVLYTLIAFYLSSMFIDMFANAIIQLPSMHYRLGCSVGHLKYETCEL